MPLHRRTLPRPGNRLLVQLHVLLGAGGPGPVLAYAGRDQLPPDLGLLAIQVTSPAKRLAQGQGAILLETEPIGRRAAGPLAAVAGDRVGQSARIPHDRQRAIFQAVELVKPTWLEPAGHQEDVASGLDPMGQRVGELQPDGDLVGISLGETLEQSVIFGLAGAENGPLNVAGLDPALNDLGDQVEAFLVGQPAHGRHQRHIGRLGQSQFLLQRGLAERLALADGVRAVLGRDMGVGGRAPIALVDPVEDARKHLPPILEDAFQSAAQGARLDLLGVARAHRVDRIREDHARLQQVQLPVKLHLMPVEVLPVEARQQHIPVPELALECDVMDRKQRGHSLVPWHVVVLDLEIGRHQTALPIVRMDDVDVEVQQPDRLQHGAAEKDEPLAVVDIILPIGPVELVAVEVLVLLDQVDRHVTARQIAAGEMPRDHFAADGHDKVDPEGFDRLPTIAGLTITWQYDCNLMAQPGQLDGQSTAHVGQTAGLGKGNRFTCRQ